MGERGEVIFWEKVGKEEGGRGGAEHGSVAPSDMGKAGICTNGSVRESC